MENLLTRHRNVTILVAVLFAEVIGLAVQVKRTTDAESVRLIRIWTVGTVTPLEEALVRTRNTVREVWHEYFYLRGVRAENRELQDEIARLRLEQVRLTEDAGQARRLQVLLGFKEQFISDTMPAQVIGSSGADVSRVVYIDKGSSDGIKQDMAVMTADGIVGRVLRVFPTSSQVLLIDDSSSGVGAILEKSRLQGVLKGTPAGETILEKVMVDERVEMGEKVLTSGGDRIFPKGLPIGTVTQVTPGADLFLTVRVKPAASLSRLEEVLVITKVLDKEPARENASTPARASDILATRLPTVPPPPKGSKTSIPPPMTGGPIGVPVPKPAGSAGAANSVGVNGVPKAPVKNPAVAVTPGAKPAGQGTAVVSQKPAPKKIVPTGSPNAATGTVRAPKTLPASASPTEENSTVRVRPATAPTQPPAASENENNSPPANTTATPKTEKASGETAPPSASSPQENPPPQ